MLHQQRLRIETEPRLQYQMQPTAHRKQIQGMQEIIEPPAEAAGPVHARRATLMGHQHHERRCLTAGVRS